jgi:hypothetical protein
MPGAGSCPGGGATLRGGGEPCGGWRRRRTQRRRAHRSSSPRRPAAGRAPRRRGEAATAGGCRCGDARVWRMRMQWAGVGRRAQRSSSQRRSAAGQAPCRAALGEQGVRSPIFFLQPALLPGAPLHPLRRPSSQLSTAALPSKGARLLGAATSMRGGPSRSPLHPSVSGGGGRATPLSRTPAGGRCRRKNAKSLLQELMAKFCRD